MNAIQVFLAATSRKGVFLALPYWYLKLSTIAVVSVDRVVG
jgi:hypothetical protein